jgi:non-heme chloroperoxidase
MGTFTTKDSTRINYNNWGTGQSVVFSHGWPLSAEAFDEQMFFLTSRGYCCIAPDRRGHGRSDLSRTRNDLDTYAGDLAALVKAFALKQAVHVGHCTHGAPTPHEGRTTTSCTAVKANSTEPVRRIV